jgi:hypothetical protein
MPNHDTKRLTQARRVIRRELAQYDALSRPPKIRRTHEHEHHPGDGQDPRSDASSYGPNRGYVCGHRISLCAPCDKCQRTIADCIEYQIALGMKLRELITQLSK